MDAHIRQLLNIIASRYELPLEEKAAELSNPAAAQTGERSPDEREREASVQARAEGLGDAFESGLRLAGARRPAPVRLSSADPEQNRMADAMIQFLVRPGLAVVQTDETAPGVFAYDISVDWPAVRRIAGEAGIDLEGALRAQA